ncbi:tyrosine-type recombinase/integrase [Leuconostoc sp. UCMA20149]|uniref:tyrosine-type recombinase/integrase n=1 Tax=Leuconostoc sp. UCMA20149 TaxID=2583528 RepID=UPI0025AF263C|nr:tyrosine-type recombinase/integrase [Leuconostoc sp. UCMA20149]MDN2451502.1 tyrosine-type recombinase/integrase [Leuconostoc sp. UCMA20149]
MVSYRKRGSVWQYEISYKDTSGKYKKLRKSGFPRKSDAISAAAQLQTNHPNLISFQSGKQLFSDYFEHWINLYKKPTVSKITFIKYQNTLQHAKQLFKGIRLSDLSRTVYQQKINKLSETHSIRTVHTFHKQLKSALLDAFDEKIISIDPTRKTVINGTPPHKQRMTLDYKETKLLVKHLDLNMLEDLVIYVAIVTGMRFAEILGLTPADIDTQNNIISITKTWDYKFNSGFKPTKTKSSQRDIVVDSETIKAIQKFVSHHKIPETNPIFVYNSHSIVSAEINKILSSKLNGLGIARIPFHGLRHTHASILLYSGVNLLSVSKRLGHSNVTTTQQTYLHIIKEMEEQDDNKIIILLQAIK